MTIALSTNVLNFVVVGQQRCGGSVVQTSVAAHPQAACLGEVLHANQQVRQDNHEAYFGPSKPELPQWFNPDDISSEQYLTTRVFDHPKHGEKVLGLRVSYAAMQQYDLWDYLHHRGLEGDFVLIHVMRNPLACFISQRQAMQELRRDQVHEVSTRLEMEVPAPIGFGDKDIKELVEFCRWHAAFETRINNTFDDRLEIDYRELFLNYPQVMQEVFAFLELPPFHDVRPGVQRLRNRNMRERLFSFETTRSRVPPDIRAYFDDKNLF